MTCGLQFPEYFPEDCPSTPHEEVPGVYHRLVADEGHPVAEDYLSWYEEGHVLSGGKVAACKDCSVSMFDTRERAENFLINNPRVTRKGIVPVNLNGGHGLVRVTRETGHIDWWIPVSVDRYRYCPVAP